MINFSSHATTFFLSLFCLASVAGNSQPSTCGPVVENFSNTGGSTAGFTGSFAYAMNGPEGYLQKKKVVASALYPVTTPTYQASSDATTIGYGFLLDGTEKIARVDVKILYISTFTDEITTVVLDHLIPAYPDATIATVCRSVSLAELPGFPAGGKYRLQVDLTSNSGSGGSSQTIVFDDFRTNGTLSQIALPVNFIGLQAQAAGNAVQLTWKVAGEENVARYEVERSSNGSVFALVGAVSKTGADVYNFTDAGTSGTLYYRVRNVDNDGRYKYSSVIKVANGRSAIVLKAYPLPVKSQLTVQHPVISGAALLQVSNAEGRTVRSLRPAAGSLQTIVDLGGLPGGIYLLRFENGDGQAEVLRVVKQ